MSRIVFLSFANKKYGSALEQIKKSVAGFGFDEVRLMTENDLPADIQKKMNAKVYHRGYGYWRWKPYLVMAALNQLQEGDILVYSDAGNRWNDAGKSTFDQYISSLKQEDCSFLVFSQPFLEKDWTKGDIFKALSLTDDMEKAMSLQLWAGCFMVRKSKESTETVRSWNHYVNETEDLVTDKVSHYPNFVGFQENRHDQSVFSLLVKQTRHKQLEWNEVEVIDGRWDKIAHHPILAKRAYKKKEKRNLCTILQKTKNKMIGLYLVRCKNFYFKDKASW